VIKKVRIIKKVRVEPGLWRFISLKRNGGRYIWDKTPGYYFIEWWEGKRRRRERAGQTPSQALEAQRRKRNEIIGELAAGGDPVRPAGLGETATPIDEAIQMFVAHIKIHSPAKPRTLERYRGVMSHFERVLGKQKYVEAVSRSHIDDYKKARSHEAVTKSGRLVSPGTINFEVNTLRSFFYFLIRERGVKMHNPCANFKPLRSVTERLKRRPKPFSPDELCRLWKACGERDYAMFATAFLAGLRRDELRYLTWDDLDLVRETIHIRAKEGFVAKDYEEREVPMPPELMHILKAVPRTSSWVFPSGKGQVLGRNEMLRRLKRVAEAAGVSGANLHRFRHTYATRQLQNGCDVVTLQRLMGHSDIETTMRYLDPDLSLMRKAASRLTLKG
jgi:integrase/recombinase XerD